jgi:hypothetical protein
MKAEKLIGDVNDLANSFIDRDRGFTKWFDMLDQVDFNADKNLESFVTNDPRTLWNMSTFLLMPKPLLHRVERMDGLPLTDDEKLSARMVERLFARLWGNKDHDYKKRGGPGWIRDFLGNLTATGWFAIPYGVAAESGLFVEFLEPHTIYPEWSDDEADEGLIKLARKWELSWAASKKLAARQDWAFNFAQPMMSKRTVTFYQLWENTEDGVFMGVAAHTPTSRRMVFPWQLITDSSDEPLEEIPYIVGGVGGLPTTAATVKRTGVSAMAQNSAGTAAASTRAFTVRSKALARTRRTVMGQSILASNENVIAQFNKTMGMMMQILSDTAYIKTFEKTDGGKPIMSDPDSFSRRGFHARMGLMDDFGAIPMPGVPPDLANSLISMRNMMQRGGFSDVTFGQLAGDVTAVLMSQATGAAQQLLSPYQEGALFVFTETDRKWFKALLDTPGFFRTKKQITEPEVTALKVLRDIKDDLIITASYTIQVPGDLVQRVNTARFASPEFEMAPEDVIRMFMPEITDVEGALARVRKARAMATPEFAQVDIMAAFAEAGRKLESTNPSLAATYKAVAARMQQELTQSPAQMPPALSGAAALVPPGGPTTGLPQGLPGTPGGQPAIPPPGQGPSQNGSAPIPQESPNE